MIERCAAVEQAVLFATEAIPKFLVGKRSFLFICMGRVTALDDVVDHALFYEANIKMNLNESIIHNFMFHSIILCARSENGRPSEYVIVFVFGDKYGIDN